MLKVHLLLTPWGSTAANVHRRWFSLRRMAIDRGLRRPLREVPEWVRAHSAAVAFVLAFAGALLIALIQSPKPFYYDSGNYWELAGSFTKNGHFSLLNFEDSIRGYALPLIYRGLQELIEVLRWSPSSVVKLFNALLFALIGGLLAPNLAELAWPTQRWRVPRRLGFMVLLLVFWSGYLNFPLSDLPALTMALLALIAVSRVDGPGWMLLAGASCGLAVEIRPEYLPLVPVLVILVLWRWYEQRRARGASAVRRALCMSLLVAGFIVVVLPQSLVTHRHYGSWSFIPGQGTGANLSGGQLGNGLEFQRYDTYVGPGRLPEMFYYDETGHHLLSEVNNETIVSLSQYAGLVAAHPIYLGGMLGRHLVNGLDERYSTPYIEHVHPWVQPLRRIAGFLLIFLAAVRVLWPAARRSLGPARWRYLVALLVCCVTSLFTAVEPRYLLPIYLVGYLLVLAPGWPSPLGQAGARLYRRLLVPAVLVVAYLASMAVVWRVVSSATDHLRFG